MNIFKFVLVIPVALALWGCGAPIVSEPEPETFPAERAVVEAEYIIDESDLLVAESFALEAEPSVLSELEIAGLYLMREEEKLARDVYLTLGDKWGIQIFSNIAASEQTHTDAVKKLIETYGLVDPVSDDSRGVFASIELQALYNQLVTQGEVSVLEALMVGATVEDLDIKDLYELMAQTDNTAILEVYANLQKGSRNHMRAFIRNISNRGGTYVAQYISPEALAAILASEQERGRAR
jgi:hypothetical protein